MKNISESINKWWEKTTAWLAIYRQTCSKKHLIIFLITIAIITIFYIPIKKLLIIKFIEPIFGDLPNSDTLRSLFVLTIFSAAIYCFIKHLRNKRIPTANSLITIFSISFVYFFLFRSDKDFYYFIFFSFDIYLSDFLWLSSLFIVSDYQLIALPLKPINSYLLEDDASQAEINNDLLYRNSFSQTIAEVINKTTPEKAIAIAILAKWGFGKTVFLRQLKDELEKDKSTNIVLPFNPWKADGNVNILQVFFEELSDKLAEYNHSATTQFKNYAQKLSYNTDNDLAIIKLAKLLFGGFFFNQLSITKQHDELNKSIQRIGKRVIVLIDDLDRLSGDELAPIMRLIRNVADFQNVIFVAAFDRSYVTNALSKTEKLTNEEKYLEKIFQVEIPLPPIKEDIITKELEKELDKILLEEHQQEFKKWIKPVEFMDFFIHETTSKNPTLKISSFISSFIKNIRDVRRFTNSFKITYDLVKYELLFKDIFMLELIKFKSIEVYDMIGNLRFLTNVNDFFYEFDSEKFKLFFEKQDSKNKYSLNSEIREPINDALLFLYDRNKSAENSENEKTFSLHRALRRKENHYLYFNYQLFGAISMREFRETSEKGFDSFKILIDKHQDKVSILLEIIGKAKQGFSEETFKSLTKGIVYCYKYFNRVDRLSDLFVSYIRAQFSKLKPESDKLVELNNFIESLLKNNLDLTDGPKTTHLLRSYITLDLLKYYPKSETRAWILSLQKLEEINKYIFDDFFENYPKDEEIIYQFLKQIWESDQPEREINKEICTKYKFYLKSSPNWYIKNLIYPYSYPEETRKLYTFDPLIRQIFGDYSEFESFLNSLPENDCVNYNKQKYSEFRDNGYKPIIIKDFRAESPCLNNE